VNALKVTMNAHFADAGGGGEEHLVADGAITEADATDLDSFVTLGLAIGSAYFDHEADAKEVTPTFHQATSSEDNSLDDLSTTLFTVSEMIRRLNDLKAKYNLHDADTVAHTDGSTHQETTEDATTEFTITWRRKACCP